MEPRLLVRDERPAEAGTVHELTRLAFLEAPHTSHTEHYIVDALRADGALAVSLVAEQAGEIIGHVALSPVYFDGADCGWLALGPISVLPARQRQGVGSALMHAAIQRMRETESGGCVLVGEPAFYRRFGFSSEHGLRMEGVPPPYLQVLQFCGESPSGLVTHHQAFHAGNGEMAGE